MIGSAYAREDVLVLGASGFIGRWVARALAQAGARLHLGSRRPPPPDLRAASRSVHLVDLLEHGALESLIAQLDPRWIFNLVGYGVDPRERDASLSNRLNAELPSRLAEATRRRDRDATTTIVHVGSMAEYGPVSGKVHEGVRPEPTTLYGRTKLAGTRALADSCRAGGLFGVTARLFMVYGPGERPGRLLPSLVETARTGRPLDLSAGTQLRDFTYVEEVAEGLLRLGAARLRGDVVNLASGRLESVRSFAETAAAILGIPPQLLRFGALPSNAYDVGHGDVAICELKRLTGWSPSLTIEQGIARSISY